MFVTGRRHAGENLARILTERTANLGPPIQMCDALSRNLPKPFAVIVGDRLAHARRHVVDVVPSFSRRVSADEALGAVHRHDAEAREQRLSADDRLAYHHTHSGPVLDALHVWLTQLDEHLAPERRPTPFSRSATPSVLRFALTLPACQESGPRVLPGLHDDVDDRRFATLDDGDGPSERRTEILRVLDRSFGVDAHPCASFA